VYRQAVEGHGLSVEQDTPATPNDGYYYVIFRGEHFGRFRSLSRALTRYNELKSTLNLERTDAPKPSLEDLRRLDMETMSNKALIWTEEDFSRVQRKTQGKKGTRSAG